MEGMSLLEGQARLMVEADAVVHMLGLDHLLSSIGTPHRVGSSAMGLMVRRDIDITVVCPSLDNALEAFAAIGARLMQMPSVSAVRFRNDTGVWNVEPDAYPDGLYLGLSVRAETGALWTLDIWLVDQPERQPDLRHLRTLLPRITEQHRLTILRIKQVLADRPGPVRVPSAKVYEAVVDHGIEDVDQFDSWYGLRSP
jgi:hypothetical protein